MTVSVTSALATNTFASGASDQRRRQEPEPVETEPVVTKLVGLLVSPSLSTLRVLLDLLAM